MVTTEPNLKKKSPKETGEKQHLFFYADVTKIQKTRVIQALRASLHVRMRTLAFGNASILVPRAAILLASATDRELWKVPTEGLVLIG